MKKTILGFSAALLLWSCGAVPQGNISKIGRSQLSLSNTQWQLAETTKGKQPTLIIEEGKISGSAPCNRYFGELNVDPATGSFDARKIGSTKMACDAMSAESAYLNMLDEANKYVLSGNQLELYKNNLLLMKFTKL